MAYPFKAFHQLLMRQQATRPATGTARAPSPSLFRPGALQSLLHETDQRVASLVRNARMLRSAEHDDWCAADRRVIAAIAFTK
jgi:hypothetical protein